MRRGRPSLGSFVSGFLDAGAVLVVPFDLLSMGITVALTLLFDSGAAVTFVLVSAVFEFIFSAAAASPFSSASVAALVS